SARTLYRSVREQIFSLPDDCLIYPAHDYRGLTASSVGEERRHNPRLAERVLEDDFVGYMDHLGLAHPRQMEVAVPANLKVGRDEPGPADADWAPLTCAGAGVWGIAPEWLEEHGYDWESIEVRGPAEFAGPLGHIDGAK